MASLGWSFEFSRSCRQQSRRREGAACRPSVHVVAIRLQSTRVTVFADIDKLLCSLGSVNCRKRQSFDREGQRDVCKHCTRNWHRAISWRTGGLYLGPYRFVRRRFHDRGRSTAIWADPLRVTHWQPLRSRDPNLSCVYDSAPRGRPKPRILIIPPTIERHAGGDCLLLVVLYRLLDGSHGEKAKLRPCWRQA